MRTAHTCRFSIEIDRSTMREALRKRGMKVSKENMKLLLKNLEMIARDAATAFLHDFKFNTATLVQMEPDE